MRSLIPPAPFSLFLLLAFFPGSAPAQPGPADTVIRGIRVVFRYSPGIFPLSWQRAPISARATAIDTREIPRSKAMLSKALDKYPAVLLAKELRAVYFIRNMKFYGIGYGGTNTTDALYICNNGLAAGYTDRYLEQSFHHEFSSILYRNYPAYLRKAEWEAACGPGFAYNDPENGVGAIRNNESSQELDTALCAKGFLTQYSQSGLENDLNTVAQFLFAPSRRFWELAEKYPLVRSKVNLLIGFYNRLNPVFTESYFKKFKPEE